MMSTIEPGLGRTAGFSTSFWKIHGWVERQAFLSRTTVASLFIATFYAGRFPPLVAGEARKAALHSGRPPPSSGHAPAHPRHAARSEGPTRTGSPSPVARPQRQPRFRAAAGGGVRRPT